MDELQLSEPLQRYFSDIFLLCDEESSGKASLNKTVEIIKTGNVSEDTILQISEVCWNNAVNYLNRQQFFSGLKLVAAHQAGMEITNELITKKIELPLPRFTWNSSKTSDSESPVQDLIELSNDFGENLDTTTSDSEFESDTLSIVRHGSPDEVSSVTSDSPTPTNSVQDKSWAIKGAWQGLVSEEQRQLLGTEEESSDKHSSEEDTEISQEVWVITPEQREYYTKQFKVLQPDPNALLAGPQARMFFEKSRLPVLTLRKIWQLADVTKDGALSLQEFMIAMHLVVLKRNHIELPDTLPAALCPPEVVTPRSNSPESEPILSPQSQSKDTKEWTKFIDSPTSSVSSPGPKPVNFDFQKDCLDKDPKILHPVALRLTPEHQNEEATIEVIDGPSPKFETTSQNLAIQRPQPKKIIPLNRGAIPPPPLTNNYPEEGPVSLPAFPPPKKEKPPPPPPRPFKTHGRSSSLDLNRLSKPAVPPRVSPNQDGKVLVNQKSEGDSATYETPFANFDHLEQYENVSEEGIFPGDMYEAERKKIFAQYSNHDTIEEAPRRHGAFEVYRKPPKSPISLEEKAKWELFQQMQEENTRLLRTCQELSLQLADIREEKMQLKIKLEKIMDAA